MSKRDYYEILGLPKNASDEDIKKAYRTAAMKYHPDRNKEPGSEDKFKEAKEAYECLGDSEKRQQYDQHGHNDPFAHGRRQTWQFNAGDDHINNVFNNIFGNRGFRVHEGVFGQQQPHQQVIHIITISLADAYTGRTIKPDTKTVINIPKGVRSGTTFFAEGKLYRVDVQQHQKFMRSLDDLMIDIEITAIEAMLGVEVVLEHLDGSKLQFNVPISIQHGQIIKLNAKGMKNPETDRYGDMMVRISIVVPKDLSEEQKITLKTFSHRESINI